MNDTEQKSHQQPSQAIVKNIGVTASERYLAALAERSFLNLWCYPSPYIDKRANSSGAGKELCDLLVVCGDYVLLFSDKTISWPNDSNTELSWRRWYRRAIENSADQIRGAERWINRFPERIFLDSKCTRKLPIELPPSDRRKIHRIVVALGAGSACKSFFGEGIGSLMINPAIQGDQHWKSDIVTPFSIGDIDPTGGFIHVLDDASLDIVLKELDTISDFTTYLTKKEALFRSGKLITAAGEEDLLAYYITHMNNDGEHDFTKPDGSSLGANDFIGFATGFHAQLLGNPQYKAKKDADSCSYVWDDLIQMFTRHLLAGTSVSVEGMNIEFREHERAVRYMAMVSRFERRNYGGGILDALVTGKNASRFVRAFLPEATELNQHTAFFFMTLAMSAEEPKLDYDQYRSFRRYFSMAYSYAYLRKFPNLKRIIGIATEPPSTIVNAGSSEDLILVEQPEWTPDLIKKLEVMMEELGILKKGNFTLRELHENEFPDKQP